MQRIHIFNHLQEIVRTQLDDPSIQVDEATEIDNIPGWDSIAHVSIMVAIEGRYSIIFDPDKYSSFANMGEMVDFIIEMLAKNDINAQCLAARPSNK